MDGVLEWVECIRRMKEEWGFWKKKEGKEEGHELAPFYDYFFSHEGMTGNDGFAFFFFFARGVGKERMAITFRLVSCRFVFPRASECGSLG